MKPSEIQVLSMSPFVKSDDFNSARATRDPGMTVSGKRRKRHFPAVFGISSKSGGASLRSCQKCPGIPGIRGLRHGSRGPVSQNRTFHSPVCLVRERLFRQKAEKYSPFGLVEGPGIPRKARKKGVFRVFSVAQPLSDRGFDGWYPGLAPPGTW